MLEERTLMIALPQHSTTLAFVVATILSASTAMAQTACERFGPQAPRDIASHLGANTQKFVPAPAATEMNLCNIHLHVNAEHKGPGFSINAGMGVHGGYRCNATDSLTESERAPLAEEGAFEGVAPGDTIEVHWVHTSCDVSPGKGLGSCSSASCVNPQLRVESQVFLLVNDPDAPDFRDFVYAGTMRNDLHQAKSLPSATGVPVVFAGSTTGPKFSGNVCSPYQVTWSVRPECAKLDIASLHAWAENGNAFEESEAHGVRELVTDPALLAKIE